MSMNFVLIDAGPLIAVYSKSDQHHKQVWDFLQNCTHKLITTDACIAEAMYALRRSTQVQRELAHDIADGIWQRKALESNDFHRISELLNQYSNLPADFADLSLVVISERLDISKIVTLDSDFDVYRRYRTPSKPFEHIFWPRPMKRINQSL
jgi:uncharacterized protein